MIEVNVLNDVLNVFKINKKDTRTTAIVKFRQIHFKTFSILIWSFSYQIFTYSKSTIKTAEKKKKLKYVQS